MRVNVSKTEGSYSYTGRFGDECRTYGFAVSSGEVVIGVLSVWVRSRRPYHARVIKQGKFVAEKQFAEKREALEFIAKQTEILCPYCKGTLVTNCGTGPYEKIYECFQCRKIFEVS